MLIPPSWLEQGHADAGEASTSRGGYVGWVTVGERLELSGDRAGTSNQAKAKRRR